MTILKLQDFSNYGEVKGHNQPTFILFLFNAFWILGRLVMVCFFFFDELLPKSDFSKNFVKWPLFIFYIYF
jgi:hypothetical protein